MKPSAGALPNLILIGAPKCGTTSLHRYLSLHPEISMSSKKELHFFVEELNWNRGVDWYRGHFRASAKVRGESSPLYACYPRYPRVPEKISQMLPDAKFLYLVRDPIERIVSHYVELHHQLGAGRDLAAELEPTDTNEIVVASKYGLQFERYLGFFPKDRFLVLEQRDLMDRRVETVRKVFEFLGVDPDFTAEGFEELHNTGDRKLRYYDLGIRLHRLVKRTPLGRLPREVRNRFKFCYRPFERPASVPVLTDALRRSLTAYLESDLRKFRALTGRRFEDWTV